MVLTMLTQKVENLVNGFNENIWTSLDATASMWYERPRFGLNAKSRTGSNTVLMTSTLNHFLQQTAWHYDTCRLHRKWVRVTQYNMLKVMCSRVCGVHKITSVQFLVRFHKKLWFSVRFQFYKINGGFVFFQFGFYISLSMPPFMPLQYDARNDVLPCWIGKTNCQPKWLRTRSAEIRHEEKYFDCWSYHVGRWIIVNETTWKRSPNRRSRFLKTKLVKLSFRFLNCGNWVFSFEYWGQFSSVFRKLLSDIFIGFCTPLMSHPSTDAWLL